MFTLQRNRIRYPNYQYFAGGGGGGGGGAPTDASYVTTNAEAGLSNEKVFGASVFYPPDILANRPGAATTVVGALYFATDAGGSAGLGALYRSDGVSVWERVAVDKEYADSLYQPRLRDTFSNADKTVTAGTAFLAQTGTMSATRTVTLPAASSQGAGIPLWIGDESGTVSASFTVVIQRAGADTIDGTTSVTLATAYASVVLVSDGSSKWTLTGQNMQAGTGITLTPSGPNITLAASVVDIQEFTSSGTWTKPTGARLVFARLVGPGSGGGGGRCGAAGTARFGGGGGGSGGAVDAWLEASELGATETVTIGAGTAGGAGGIAAGGDGGNAATAGNTTFGSHLSAAGGGFLIGGAGGTNASGTGGPGSLFSKYYNAIFGTALSASSGGNSSTSATAASGQSGAVWLPGGGGAGGGIDTGNTRRDGGVGGAGWPGNITGGTAGTGSNGVAGGAGASQTNGYQNGAGGGGGTGSTVNTTNGGAGGNGGYPGGGGGGGGAGTSGGTATGGAGGNGANGYCLVMSIISV